MYKFINTVYDWINNTDLVDQYMAPAEESWDDLQTLNINTVKATTDTPQEYLQTCEYASRHEHNIELLYTEKSCLKFLCS